jgi:glutamine synthetase type III
LNGTQPPADDAPSELECAYRALALWEEERMQPQLDAQVSWFRARVAELLPHPVQAFQAAMKAETMSVALWFQENERTFLREAVSYLGDDVLQGLKAIGCDQQFIQVILEALDDAREDLRNRMHEIREAADAAATGGGAAPN